MDVEKSEVLRGILDATLVIIKTIFLKILKLFIPKNLKNIFGQLVLITGSAQGLGCALAHSLAAEGCNLALADINHEKNQKVAEKIRRNFPEIKVKAYKVDVSKNDEIQKLKNQIKADLGCVDILVNNAALLELEHSILEGDAEIYQKIIDVNLMSHFWTLRAFLPDMVKNCRGHIVALSSFGVNFNYPFNSVYITSKAAIDTLMKTLNEELRYSNLSDFIKTTTVYPNMILSESLVVHQKVNIWQNTEIKLPRPKRNEPNFMADEIVVKGLLLDQQEIYLPKLEVNVLRILAKLPFEVRRIFWKVIMRTYDEYLIKRGKIYDKLMRREKC